MTYELLMKIVSETLKRIEAMSGLRVGAFSFYAENDAEVKAAAASINGNCSFLDNRDLDGIEPFDIFFIDMLPQDRVPNLALGIACDVVEKCLLRVILNGGGVIVLRDCEPPAQKAPNAFRELMGSYRRMLESYGYVFLKKPSSDERMGNEPEALKSGGPRFVYREKFMCREDLLKYASDGVLLVGEDVHFTDMALEAARSLNVRIMRAGDNSRTIEGETTCVSV